MLLVCVLLLASCGTIKRQANETSKSESVANVDLTVKETASQSSYSDVVKDVKNNVSDKSVTRTTETEYSEPDSTGRQHKKRETVTETKNDIQTINEENKRIIGEQRGEIDRLTASNSELRTKLEASHREEIKTSTRMPIWTYIVTFIVGAGLSLILRSWLKGIFKY